MISKTENLCLYLVLMLRLALWPMATKIPVWATNFQAALAQRDQWVFNFMYTYYYIDTSSPMEGNYIG